MSAETEKAKRQRPVVKRLTDHVCEHCGNSLERHPMTFKTKTFSVLRCSGNADPACFCRYGFNIWPSSAPLQPIPTNE